jgi:transcriptional adapter 2-alpha
MGLIMKAKGTPSSGGSGGGVKFICNKCSNDITNTVRIRCRFFKCKDYDLCVTCFSEGEKSENHDPTTHPYNVIEPHSIPIFDEGWGADEELLLLEGAEQYGLGSWADVADHIGNFREKDEVRDHYINTYVNSSKFPLPERASPSDTSLSDSIPREEFQVRKKRRIEERKEIIAATQITGPLQQKPTSSVPSCHEVAGYMPGRLEFETEHLNEAEEAVQHMQFSPDEGFNPATGQLEPELDLKMVVMGVYNDRLTARTDRKRVIFNHRLLEYRKNTAIDKKRTKDQRDLHHKLKPFARMMSHPDFVSISDDLEKEQNLRQAITQLQDWRRMRISTLTSGEKYEAEKTTRQARTAQALGQFDRLASNVRANKQAQQPHETAQAVTDYTTKDIPVRLSSTNPSALSSTNPNTTTNGTTNGNGLATPPLPSPKSRASLQPVPTITPLPMNGDNAPDWQLLLPNERDLCVKLRLQPKPYLAIKAEVFREAMKQDGKLKKKNVRELSNVDTTKGGRIFEFMLEEGWLGNAARA